MQGAQLLSACVRTSSNPSASLPSISPGADALPESLRRVQEIVHQPILFQELDITDEAALQELFSKVRARAAVPQGGLMGSEGCEGFVLGVGPQRGMWTGQELSRVDSAEEML